MYSVCFKKDFATRGASACAARAIPSSKFDIRYSIFCGSLFCQAAGCQSSLPNHQKTVPFGRSFIFRDKVSEPLP
jgi:hypothetical protein